MLQPGMRPKTSLAATTAAMRRVRDVYSARRCSSTVLVGAVWDVERRRVGEFSRALESFFACRELA